MADFRYFRCSTWHDDYVLELDPHAKLLFVWAFTNEHVSQAGFMTLHPRTAAFETGLSIEEVNALLDRFERDGKILRDGRLIFVANFPKHQSTSSEKLLKRIARDLEALGQTPLVDEFRRRYPQLILKASPSPDPSSPTKEKKEGKGKTECIDTVSEKPDTVSTPLPKNLPFEQRDKIVELRLERQGLTERRERMQARGDARDRQGYTLKETEASIAQIDRTITAILEANR
jgi:hypothetical protein